jgi:hypothetical protein
MAGGDRGLAFFVFHLSSDFLDFKKSEIPAFAGMTEVAFSFAGLLTPTNDEDELESQPPRYDRGWYGRACGCGSSPCGGSTGGAGWGDIGAATADGVE